VVRCSQNLLASVVVVVVAVVVPVDGFVVVGVISVCFGRYRKGLRVEVGAHTLGLVAAHK
jgi:hypothetical protein